MDVTFTSHMIHIFQAETNGHEKVFFEKTA